MIAALELKDGALFFAFVALVVMIAIAININKSK